jgi:septum formation protein
MPGPRLRQPIILASQSPRRAELLRGAGIPFEVVPPGDEEPSPLAWAGSPAEFAEHVSFLKARQVAARLPNALVLAADTIVAVGNEIFGKPADRDDARRILSSLCGVTQDVITGVTLMHFAAGRQLTRHDVTRVTMRQMSPAELDAYLDSGDWQGKAGAYGIQDSGDAFITRVEGSFTNVVGLPMELVERMLGEFTECGG